MHAIHWPFRRCLLCPQGGVLRNRAQHRAQEVLLETMRREKTVQGVKTRVAALRVQRSVVKLGSLGSQSLIHLVA